MGHLHRLLPQVVDALAVTVPPGFDSRDGSNPNIHTVKTEQVITELAAEMAEHINENKSPDGYTIVCTHLELHHMVGHRVKQDVDLHDAVHLFFDEMECEHGMFLEVSQFNDVVLDEREEV